MTLDEAIVHAREVASRKFDDRVHCIKCAEEHEQLAEWLEELKQYRATGTLEECRAAMEKQTAISREIIEGNYVCPKCHSLMPYPGYCGCGQRLY